MRTSELDMSDEAVEKAKKWIVDEIAPIILAQKGVKQQAAAFLGAACALKHHTKNREAPILNAVTTVLEQMGLEAALVATQFGEEPPK